MDFANLHLHIAALSEAARETLLAIPPAERHAPYQGSSAWTKTELLGHLVDSALNNHQRFVRALIEDEVMFPSYAQAEMVQAQNYRGANWEWLVEHWLNLNRHIALVLRNAPAEKAATRCLIGTNPPMTFGQLAVDYVAHMEHHLRQLAGERILPYSGLPWPPPDRWQDELGRR